MLIDKMQFIIYYFKCQPELLQYEQTSAWANRKDLWIMTHTKMDENPIDAASGETVVAFIT